MSRAPQTVLARGKSITHYILPLASVLTAKCTFFCRIATELLARGCNVILHGRNPAKLEAARRELSLAYPLSQTDVFLFDASQQNLAPGTPSSSTETDLYTAVSALLKGRRLTILVNNVGYTSSFESVWEHTPSNIDIMTTVGLRFMTHLTRACLPYLLSPSTPSLIINVTGLTAEYAAPFLAIHSGAKAYIENFSRALSIELVVEGRKEVECIAVDVHNVASNSNSSGTSFFTCVLLSLPLPFSFPFSLRPFLRETDMMNATNRPTAAQEAHAILSVVGCGRRVVTAYWRHDLMAKALALTPRFVMDKAMAREMVKMRAREREEKLYHKGARVGDLATSEVSGLSPKEAELLESEAGSEDEGARNSSSTAVSPVPSRSASPVVTR